MRAVVTGGSGFVGSHLIQDLVRSGWDVMSLDVQAPRADMPLSVQMTHREADLLGRGVIRMVEDEWEDADVVFHLAAAPWNASQDDEFVRTNTYGTLQALQVCKALGARFVLASSMMVYGEARHTPFTEWDTLRPYSPYGYSKWLAEQITQHFSAHYEVPASILRFSNIYGPGQERYRHLFPDLLRKLQQDPSKLVLKGTGYETRDFLYVDDAIAAYRKVQAVGDRGCLSYNVGTGLPTTIKDIAALLFALWNGCSLLEARSKLAFTGSRGPHDPEQAALALDAQRLRERGWRPQVALDEGIRRTVQAFKALPDQMKKPLV